MRDLSSNLEVHTRMKRFQNRFLDFKGLNSISTLQNVKSENLCYLRQDIENKSFKHWVKYGQQGSDKGQLIIRIDNYSRLKSPELYC